MKYYLLNLSLLFIEIQAALWFFAIYITHTYISGLDVIAGIGGAILISSVFSLLFSLSNFIFRKTSFSKYWTLIMHFAFCLFLVIRMFNTVEVSKYYPLYKVSEDSYTYIDLDKIKHNNNISANILPIGKSNYRNFKKFIKENKISYFEKKSWWGDRKIIIDNFIFNYLGKSIITKLEYEDGRYYTNDRICMKVDKKDGKYIYNALVKLYGNNYYAESDGSGKKYCWINKNIIAEEPYYIVFSELNNNYDYGIVTIGIGKSFIVNKVQKI